MATAPPAAPRATKDLIFDWEGKDRNGRVVRGEMRAGGEAAVNALLRRQGIMVTRVRKRRLSGGRAIGQKDLAIFTRQLAAMMKAGVPLLQSFDIVGRGATNPRLARLVNDIRADIETGTSLSAAFRKHPLVFDPLYCSLVEAGEAGGILEALLDRLAFYQEKTVAIKQKIKSALMYPVAVLIVAAIVISVIMIFVVPSFKSMFANFGATLPAPTLLVVAISEFFVQWWWAMLVAVVAGAYFLGQSWRRSEKVQAFMDRTLLRVPVFGGLVEKSVVARWTRTMSTLFAAGVPLVEALDSVGGASGNSLYAAATEQIQREVSAGGSLTNAMQNAGVFPVMVLQMAAIGEESGSIDQMLSKAAEFYEEEVDQMVKGLSSLMEPFVLVFLGGLIAAIVIAMYLPLFKMGAVV
ncbi:MAG: type II secretion system F family protein [Rubrivivax sp.]